MFEKIRAAWRAYSEGGFSEVGFRTARFYLAPPEWIGMIDLQKGDTVLDLGGYKGDFAQMAAKQVGPSGRVLTIEPNPQNLNRLRENCRGLDNVEVVEGAITESHGESELRIHSENPAGHRMRHEQPNDRDEPPEGDAEFVPVKTYTLDSLCEVYGIDDLNFIKIDIEGGEIAALRSGSCTLDATDRIMIEAYHEHPTPESKDRTCGPDAYKILHRHCFNVAVTEDYMIFGWKNDRDKAPLLRRTLFTIFSGRYGIDRI